MDLRPGRCVLYNSNTVNYIPAPAWTRLQIMQKQNKSRIFWTLLRLVSCMWFFLSISPHAMSCHSFSYTFHAPPNLSVLSGRSLGLPPVVMSLWLTQHGPIPSWISSAFRPPLQLCAFVLCLPLVSAALSKNCFCPCPLNWLLLFLLLSLTPFSFLASGETSGTVWIGTQDGGYEGLMRFHSIFKWFKFSAVLIHFFSLSVLVHSASGSRRRCLQSVSLSEGVHSLVWVFHSSDAVFLWRSVYYFWTYFPPYRFSPGQVIAGLANGMLSFFSYGSGASLLIQS